MDAFEALRKQAREKRNEAISLARAEYRQSIQQIDELQRGLGCGYRRVSRSKTQPLQDLMLELIPKDRPFTVNDMVGWMKAKHPLRNFNTPTIRAIIPHLSERGVIHRVGRDAKGCVLWAAVGSKVKVSPYAAMPLTEVAEVILKERGPMRLVELVLAMQQAGFRKDADPRRLMQSLRWANKRYAGRFQVGEDGRWEMAANSA